MSHYKDTLLVMIHRVLSGEWTVERFTDEYYRFFLDKVPSDALSPADEDFFSTVQEKTDWTSENPSEEEREFGWIDYAEFIQWLRTEVEFYNIPDGSCAEDDPQ